MYDALYARQSIDKADSISIESQMECCKYEARGNPYKEYIDRGYSGKNTNRPAFEELMKDIRQGEITRVIVYKLDRISRSILDFANMMEIFGQYSVEFISSTERFDTSTPIGRAMLNICIVFAQLERETIQKRVADAYYARCKRGFYMGGRIPYGFSKTETVMDGVKTSMYVPIPEEAEQICMMYNMYAVDGNSLGDIISYFHKNGIKQLRGSTWSTARISELLRNPIYVRADAEVYDFFRKQEVNILNPVEDFAQENGCYLYKGASETQSGKNDLRGKSLVLAPHRGIVSSEVWIKCRQRCLLNKRSTRTCKAKNSWLVGKVKCGNCGHSLIIAKSNTKWHRYFLCGNAVSTKKIGCTGTGDTVYVDLMEKYVSNAIENKLGEFKILQSRKKSCQNPKSNQLKISIAQVEKEIDELLLKVVNANAVLMEYINQRIEALDLQKRELQAQLEVLAEQQEDKSPRAISNPESKWREATFESKQAIVDVLIKVITVSNGSIEITWNI